jgi:hypothetical protein
MTIIIIILLIFTIITITMITFIILSSSIRLVSFSATMLMSQFDVLTSLRNGDGAAWPQQALQDNQFRWKHDDDDKMMMMMIMVMMMMMMMMLMIR